MSEMISTCPLCFRKVIETRGGKCPSCGNKMDGQQEPKFHLISISEADTLPNRCFLCLKETKNRKTVKYSARLPTVPPENYSWEEKRGGGLLMFFLEWLVRKKNVRLKLPVCKECENRAPIHPQSVDWDRKAMSLICNVGFR